MGRLKSQAVLAVLKPSTDKSCNEKSTLTEGCFLMCYSFSRQPLHTSTQASQRLCCSSSGMVSSMALLLLPQAGYTVEIGRAHV